MAHDHAKDHTKVNAAWLEAEAETLAAEMDKYRAETEHQSSVPGEGTAPVSSVK